MEFFKNIFSYQEAYPLQFTQMYFWGFLAVVLTIYSIIYKQRSLRNAYLFIVSLFFYWKTGGVFFSLLIFSTVVDYSIGLFISKANKQGVKRLFVTLSVLINLGVLAYFKYSYLFVDFINLIVDQLRENDVIYLPHYEVVNVLAKWANSISGKEAFDASTIILPVGISFYTFQTISYSVDVFRKRVEPVRNILDFAFYVSFFPQLVAGPIVRAAEFIPQLYQKYSLTSRQMGHAVFLILNGLVKKMVISDYISINFVDQIFDEPSIFSGFENLMATYGYSIQIYCDFSGYTDIAIGVSLLLGIRLPLNFYSPYKADSITDFWRRWHISLSTWLRDYLYIPLGGSKRGFVRTLLHLIITMLLGGLWHGASIRFIIWGALHGVALAAHKIWLRLFPKLTVKGRIGKILAISTTFHFVTFAWIFFRAEDMPKAKAMISKLWEFFSGQMDVRGIGERIFAYKWIFLLMIGAFIIHWLPSSWKEYYRGWFIKTPIYLKVLIVVFVIFVIYQFRSSELQPFIYFQF